MLISYPRRSSKSTVLTVKLDFSISHNCNLPLVTFFKTEFGITIDCLIYRLKSVNLKRYFLGFPSLVPRPSGPPIHRVDTPDNHYELREPESLYNRSFVSYQPLMYHWVITSQLGRHRKPGCGPLPRPFWQPGPILKPSRPDRGFEYI